MKNGITIKDVRNNKEFSIFPLNQEENEITTFIKEFTDALNDNDRSKLDEVIDLALGRYEVLEVDEIIIDKPVKNEMNGEVLIDNSDKPAENVNNEANSTQTPKHAAAPFNLQYQKTNNKIHGRNITEINYEQNNNSTIPVPTVEAAVKNASHPTVAEPTVEAKTTAKPSFFNKVISIISSRALGLWKMLQKALDSLINMWERCFGSKTSDTKSDINDIESTAPVEQNAYTPSPLKKGSPFLGWGANKKPKTPSTTQSIGKNPSRPKF